MTVFVVMISSYELLWTYSLIISTIVVCRALRSTYIVSLVDNDGYGDRSDWASQNKRTWLACRVCYCPFTVQSKDSTESSVFPYRCYDISYLSTYVYADTWQTRKTHGGRSSPDSALSQPQIDTDKRRKLKSTDSCLSPSRGWPSGISGSSSYSAKHATTGIPVHNSQLADELSFPAGVIQPAAAMVTMTE